MICFPLPYKQDELKLICEIWGINISDVAKADSYFLVSDNELYLWYPRGILKNQHGCIVYDFEENTRHFSKGRGQAFDECDDFIQEVGGGVARLILGGKVCIWATKLFFGTEKEWDLAYPALILPMCTSQEKCDFWNNAVTESGYSGRIKIRLDGGYLQCVDTRNNQTVSIQYLVSDLLTCLI